MNDPRQFTLFTKMLHLVIGILVIAMLYIGIAMSNSIIYYINLLSIHKSLGFTILALMVIRLINRFFITTPKLPSHMMFTERIIAKSTHYLFYILLFAMPIIGYVMLSSIGTPIVIYKFIHIPLLTSFHPDWFPMLRTMHKYLAYLLFALIILHMSAALLHGLIFKDGVFSSMCNKKITNK